MTMTYTDPAPQTTPEDWTTGGGSRPTAPARSGFRAWTAGHPVGALLLIGFSLGYPVMFLPILASHGVIPDGWMPQIAGVDTERISSALLVFAALLPAVVWVTWAADGTDGLRTLRRRMLQWRVGGRWWLLLLAGVPSVTLGLALLFGDSPKQVDVVPFVTAQVVGLLVNLVLINIWEEAAWAGIVQTRLQDRHGLVKAALLTAVPFALIHMPLHFIGAFTLGSLVGALVALLIICALVRLMLGVVLSGTRGSILAVAVMHTMFNRSNNDEGIVAGLVDGDGRKLAGLVAVLVVTTVVAVLVRRRRTGTDPS